MSLASYINIIYSHAISKRKERKEKRGELIREGGATTMTQSI